MKRVKLALMSVAWLTVCATPIFADQAADEAQIRQEVEAYVAAFNQGNAKALAAKWSPEAVYTHPLTGEQVVGRDAIEQQFAAIFDEDKEAKLAATTESIEFISPSVALEHGTAIVSRPGQEPEETKYRAVYVKRDGAWLLDRVSEEEITVTSPHHQHLQSLDWLIGSWIDEDDEARIESSYQWTKNRNFITQVFSLTVGDRIEHSGLQIIGWDPKAECIRSWVFDSGGGFGEGRWSQHGQAWHVQATGILPDGSASTSTNVLTYMDENTFTWQSVNRIVAGELLPNVDEVVVVRQTEQSE